MAKKYFVILIFAVAIFMCSALSAKADWKDDLIASLQQQVAQLKAQLSKCAPSITVTSPNGGEILEKGKTYDIKWNTTGNLTGIGIVLISEDNASYNVYIGGSQPVGILSWPVPLIIPDGKYKINIFSPNQSGVMDLSDNYFTISSAPTCKPDWQCSEWSVCSNGKQTRTCVDRNKCGVITGKPTETQDCATKCAVADVYSEFAKTGYYYIYARVTNFDYTGTDYIYNLGGIDKFRYVYMYLNSVTKDKKSALFKSSRLFNYADATYIAAQDAKAFISTLKGNVICAPPQSQPGQVMALIDAATPQSQIVAGGQQVNVAKFKVTALMDSYTIKEVRFALGDQSSDTTIESAVLKDGATVIGVVAYDASNRYFNFTGLNLPLLANTSKTLSLNYNLSATISSTTGTSGKNIKTGLSYIKAESSTGAFVEITPNIFGNDIYVFKSYPMFTKQALTNSVITSGIPATLYEFKVSTDAKGDIGLRQIKFIIALDDGGIVSNPFLDNFRLFKNGNDITSLVSIRKDNGENLETSASALRDTNLENNVFIVFDNEDFIPAGTFASYKLVATPQSFSAGDRVVVSVPADKSFITPDNFASYLSCTNGIVSLSYEQGGISKPANIIWSDQSAINHSDLCSASSKDWYNGYLLRDLPLESQVLTVSSSALGVLQTQLASIAQAIANLISQLTGGGN